ncbi:flagellar hook capping FlgD N-terminal domain-containing protein [Patulibacter americanus]|uniref:flagellar hook capping FlgD N-terminal domain-containing protein n=1 Tax=Patulibacter americanus TaxID=588672 RepID=UPI0003B769F6|nr:flagellar hook capping FlgD N-terminal domain-containing protein [Patulibacter americanus]
MTTIPSTTTAPGAFTAASGAAGTSAASGTSSSTASGATAPKNALGKDAFLKLMTTQLKRQDPMKPVDDTAFLAQMAQFTTLEQITNLGDISAAQLSAQATSQALALTGKTVSYVDDKGVTKTGVVDAVVFDKGAATLTIGGAKGVQPGAVSIVHGGPVASTPSPSTAAPDSGSGTPTTVTE